MCECGVCVCVNVYCECVCECGVCVWGGVFYSCTAQTDTSTSDRPMQARN